MKRIPVIGRPRAKLDADDFYLYLGIERDKPRKANEFFDALGGPTACSPRSRTLGPPWSTTTRA